MHSGTREECCGINIINDVGYGTNKEDANRMLNSVMRILASQRGGKLHTMTLTDNQANEPAMKRYFLPGLFEMGWRLVTRFHNPHSGNIVNVFHYTGNKRVGKLCGKYKPANVGNQK